MTALKVLVVDDNEAHGEGLAELLGLGGFEAYHVFTGGEGLEFIQSFPVDAVLLDLNLPDISGYEVCRRLRANPETANIAVVFHTAVDASLRQNHQGDAFLTYPVDTSHVFHVIRGCVAKRRQEIA